MDSKNLLFIISDQHNRNCLGCYGNSIINTPNIDNLAKRGVRFSNAYTNSPICMPARAALATGQLPHMIGAWGNAFPYDGNPLSWHHRLRENGIVIDAIGKLHFRDSEDDNGFNKEINTMNAVGETGDLAGCLRHNTDIFNKRKGVINAGYGDSSYLRYDARNAKEACDWLKKHKDDEKPWALFLGFALPHPPTIAPKELYDLYSSEELPMPPQWQEENWPKHSEMDYERKFYKFDSQINESSIQNFIAAYYGTTTYMDQKVGEVMNSLREYGLEKDTRIVYTSDHGETLGARGVFGKFNMYEESVSIPFVMAGPDIPKGVVIDTPISLIDCYPTILGAFNISLKEIERIKRPGNSLWSIIDSPPDDRIVMSEYHAGGSRHGVYMLRNIYVSLNICILKF